MLRGALRRDQHLGKDCLDNTCGCAGRKTVELFCRSKSLIEITLVGAKLLAALTQLDQ